MVCCWHQLVGIYCMLQHAFEAKLVLLMDSARIGKTFQVIGFIMCLSHFHWHYNAHKKFPGAFSEWFYTQSFIHIHHPLTHSFPANKWWHDKKGNIPSAPFIIVCPVNLHNQWTCEIEWFLKRNTFNIFPYVRKHMTHCQWWEDVYMKGFHEPHHQIVLAMDSVSTCYLSAIVALTLWPRLWLMTALHYTPESCITWKTRLTPGHPCHPSGWWPYLDTKFLCSSWTRHTWCVISTNYTQPWVVYRNSLHQWSPWQPHPLWRNYRQYFLLCILYVYLHIV